MIKSKPPHDASSEEITREDLHSLIGDIDEMTAVEILALRPTVRDIEQAAMWVAGQGDILSREGEPLAGVAAQIFDILTADEEEEPPPNR